MAKLKMKSTVIEQKMIADGICSMWLDAKEVAVQAKPGQFISVYSNDKSRVLPRPISICEIDREKGTLRIVYRVVGKGTEEFSKAEAGDSFEILGPLGNGFPIEEAKGKKVLMIGGGIGQDGLLCPGCVGVLHAAVHSHASGKALERGRAVVAQVVTLAHIQEQAAGHTAAVQRHGKAHSSQLFGAHGFAQREQHTELRLHHIIGFGFVHRFPAGHGNVFRQRQRCAVNCRKLCQQCILYRSGLLCRAAQHEQFNVGGAQHLVIGCGKLFRHRQFLLK